MMRLLLALPRKNGSDRSPGVPRSRRPSGPRCANCGWLGSILMPSSPPRSHPPRSTPSLSRCCARTSSSARTTNARIWRRCTKKPCGIRTGVRSSRRTAGPNCLTPTGIRSSAAWSRATRRAPPTPMRRMTIGHSRQNGRSRRGRFAPGSRRWWTPSPRPPQTELWRCRPSWAPCWRSSTARSSALDHRTGVSLADYIGDLRALDDFSCALPDALRFARERVQSLTVAPERPRPGHLYACSLSQSGYAGRAHLFIVGLDRGRACVRWFDGGPRAAGRGTDGDLGRLEALDRPHE